MTRTPMETQSPTVRADTPAPGGRRPRAWVEQLRVWRAAATTEPGRLRIIGALLALLVVAFGAVTAWQITDRAAAADDVIHHSEPLSARAADIYRSLADADATAAGGFLAGGDDPAQDRERYTRDIEIASRNIADAAASSEDSAQAQARLERLNQRLSVYTGLVERARANNRQGFPVGGAYLRRANKMMSEEILPDAKQLWTIETARLGEDYQDAKALPLAAWGLGLVALVALVWAQRRSYRRTHRVFNPGMLAGTVATAVVLLWLVAGHGVARARLDDSYAHGARSLQVLNEARIQTLQARGNENLTLVARGGGDAYSTAYDKQLQGLAGTDADGRTGLLARALDLADDDQGRKSITSAMEAAKAWWGLHGEAREKDDAGNYLDAVAQTIGGTYENGQRPEQFTGFCFDEVDNNLADAVDHEQQEFERAAADGRGALDGLVAGAALLAVLGAAGAVLGIGRRLSEYR
ncbi:hypothetical protein PV341_27815 [Streptomyces sp. PA03-1a]|nr:hypothetical protein [Streptomyces sp. PA03-1a]MDX2812192.1 hypothetical protein [Streptomyces sp. PA03-5A]